MVFADNQSSIVSSTLFPMFLGAVACASSSTLALSIANYHTATSSEMHIYGIVSSVLLICMSASVYFMHHRFLSLHKIPIMVIWIFAAIFGLLGSLTVIGYSLYAIKLLCDAREIHTPVLINVCLGIPVSIILVPISAHIIYSRLVFMKPSIFWEDYQGHMDSLRWIRTAVGDVIPTILIKAPSQNPRFTIIYSHGNAADLGVMITGLSHLAKHIDCHIVLYDYPGYGLGGASGHLSEQHIYAAVEAVWSSVVSNNNIWNTPLPTDVVLMGRSLGTAVSTHLAALLSDCELWDRTKGYLCGTRGSDKEDSDLKKGTESDVLRRVLTNVTDKTLPSPSCPSTKPTLIGGREIRGCERLCGVVLDSPLCSTLRTKIFTRSTLPFDMFASIDRVHRISVPVYISHGTKDSVVPPRHAQELHQRLSVQARYPLNWLQGKGHNDLPKFWLYNVEKVKDAKEKVKLEAKNEENKVYLLNLRRFLTYCEKNSVYHTEADSQATETSFDEDNEAEVDVDNVDNDEGETNQDNALIDEGVDLDATADCGNTDAVCIDVDPIVANTVHFKSDLDSIGSVASVNGVKVTVIDSHRSHTQNSDSDTERTQMMMHLSDSMPDHYTHRGTDVEMQVMSVSREK